MEQEKTPEQYWDAVLFWHLLGQSCKKLEAEPVVSWLELPAQKQEAIIEALVLFQQQQN